MIDHLDLAAAAKMSRGASLPLASTIRGPGLLWAVGKSGSGYLPSLRVARLSSEWADRLDRGFSLQESVAQVQLEICDSLFGLILHNLKHIFQPSPTPQGQLTHPPTRLLKAELRHFCVNCDVAN